MNTQLYFLKVEKHNDGRDIGFVYKVLHVYDQCSALVKSCDEWGNSRGGSPAVNTDTDGEQSYYFDSLQDLQQYAAECDIRLLKNNV